MFIYLGSILVIYDDISYGEVSTSITGFTAGLTNLTVPTSVAISLPVSVVDFGSLGINKTDNTTDNNPSPFIVQNDGTTFVNITIEASDLFNGTGASNPSSYYTFKIDSNSDGPDSVSNWTSVPAQSSPLLGVHALEYSDPNDTAEIEIKLKIPSDESPGDKSSLVTFTAIDAS